MAENYEGVVNHSEEPNLFGAMSSIGFQMYGYVLAQNAGRAASNYKRMYDAHNPKETKVSSSYSGHRNEYSSFDEMSSEKKVNFYQKKARKSAGKYKKYDKKYQKSFDKGNYKRGARNYIRRSDSKADFKKFRRAASNETKYHVSSDVSSQMKGSHHVSSGEVQKLDDVFLHMNIPFTGRLDKGGLGSISKAYNGLKASNDVISSGFRYNNYHFISQLSDVGFSKEEVNILKDFSKLRNKSKYFSDYNGVNNFVGEGDNLINSLLNSKKFKKKSPVNIEQVQNILNKTDESGELLIKKVSPNISQTSTKGVGVAFNLTKFAEKMPTLSKYLFTGARVAAGIADGLLIYDLVKTTGEIAINTYKNTDGYKDMEDKKFMARNHIKSYDQMASFEDTVLSSRISSNQTIQEERALIQSALSAKTNVNEVLRQSIGGYSVNELAVNKVRKSGR